MGYFDGLNFDEAFKSLQPPEPKGQGVARGAADTALSFARGAVQGTKMLADAFGAANPVSQTLERGAEWLSQNFSDHAKWEELTSAQDQQAAALSGSTWEEIKAAARSFAKRPVDFLTEAAGTSLPTIAAAFLPGGQGALLGRVAMMGMGAVQGAGAVKGQIHQTVEEAWKRAGASSAEAIERADAAQEYFGTNAGQIALGTALGALASGTGVEAGVLAARAGAPAAASAAAPVAGLFAKAAARTPRFLREGLAEALPEAAQGGQEQLAANLALGNEGFETPPMQGVVGSATLEGLAGAGLGAAVSPLTRQPAAPASRSRSDEGMDELAAATTTEEAISAAMKAADVPLAPQGLSAEQEARALGALDAQAKDDLDAIKQAGRRMSVAEQRASAAGQPGEAPAMPEPVVRDEPFADRVLTLREQLADPGVRDRLRALDARAFELVHQYASIADRPDVNLPEKTRERLLSLAEGIVSRAIAQPIQRATTAAGAEPSSAESAATALPGRTGVPRLELDSRPTGTIRVDTTGRAAPETRADTIDTRQRVEQLRQRRDGMEAKGRRASAVYGEPGPASRPAPEVTRAPRTRLAEALQIDPGAPNAVAQMIERARAVNTPAARAFVKDFEAGRISSQDILARLVPTAEPTADERLAAAAAHADNSRPSRGLVDAYGRPLASTRLDEHAHAAATSPTNTLPEPSEAQKEAGNYRKGHIKVGGLDISVENPAGSTRRGVDGDGNAWENQLQHHYGYIRRTTGADGDHVDVFVKPGTPQDYSGPVFVIDQVDPHDGKFDESKVMLGFSGMADAKAAYLKNYAADWQGGKSIRAMSMLVFRKWLADAGATQRPASDWRGNGRNEARVATRAFEASAVQALAEREGSVQQPQEPVLSQLRGARDQAVPGVAEQLPGLHGRDRAAAESAAHAGSQGERRQLRAGQRDLGDKARAGQQPAQEPQGDARRANADDRRVGAGTGSGVIDGAQPSRARKAGRTGVDAGSLSAGEALPVERLAELVDLTGRDREQVAKQYLGLVKQHGREKADQMLDGALKVARARPAPGPEPKPSPVAAQPNAASSAPQPQPEPDGVTAAATEDAAQSTDGPADAADQEPNLAAEPAAAPAAPQQSAADNRRGDDEVDRTEEGGARVASTSRPAELIALRKRAAILKSIKECLNA